jgi:hypothetical protein
MRKEVNKTKKSIQDEEINQFQNEKSGEVQQELISNNQADIKRIKILKFS